MGARWNAWLGLRAADKVRLLACALGVVVVHAGLASRGYMRTRRSVEALTRRRRTRVASAEDLANARQLARLAATAGRHGPVDATCLRQSLLVHGWLRLRGLQPVLQLGPTETGTAQFQAHAWVELDGQRLLPADAGHRAFVSPARRSDAT